MGEINMSVLGGGSRGKSSQSSKSRSGVSKKQRKTAATQGISNLLQVRPEILSFLSNVPSLSLSGLSNFAQNPTAQQLALGPRGLTAGQSSFARDFVTDATTQGVNKFSGDIGRRGGLSPENIRNVIGSAAERAAISALPQFIQASGANEAFNVGARQANQLFNTQSLQQQQLTNLANLNESQRFNATAGQQTQLAGINALLGQATAFAPFTQGSEGKSSGSARNFAFNFGGGLKG